MNEINLETMLPLKFDHGIEVLIVCGSIFGKSIDSIIGHDQFIWLIWFV